VKKNLRIAGGSEKIRTRHLLNRNPKHYRYVCLLYVGISVFQDYYCLGCDAV
jgi:hypothetical protein